MYVVKVDCQFYKHQIRWRAVGMHRDHFLNRVDPLIEIVIRLYLAEADHNVLGKRYTLKHEN